MVSYQFIKINYLKISLSFFLVILSTVGFSQKLKYNKDVYPLIKERNNEAFDKLKVYVIQNPKHSNALYWLSKYYDSKSFNQSSLTMADLAIETYKQCLKNTSLLDLTVINAHRFPDAKGLESEELYLSLKEYVNNRISQLEKLKQEVKVNSLTINKLTISEFKSKFNIPIRVNEYENNSDYVVYGEVTTIGLNNLLDGPFHIYTTSKDSDLNAEWIDKKEEIKGTYKNGKIIEIEYIYSEFDSAERIYLLYNDNKVVIRESSFSRENNEYVYQTGEQLSNNLIHQLPNIEIAPNNIEGRICGFIQEHEIDGGKYFLIIEKNNRYYKTMINVIYDEENQRYKIDKSSIIIEIQIPLEKDLLNKTFTFSNNNGIMTSIK